jgi:hypothetical protein
MHVWGERDLKGEKEKREGRIEREADREGTKVVAG